MQCNKTDCIHRPACEAWEFMGNENNINADADNCDWYQSKRDIEREVENEIRQEVQDEHDREVDMIINQARELLDAQQRNIHLNLFEDD